MTIGILTRTRDCYILAGPSQGSVRARFDARALSYRSAMVRAKRCWSSRTISVNANLTRALLRNRHFNG